MLRQLLPVTERLVQLAEMLRFTARISPFDAGTRRQTAFLPNCERTHIFYSWSWHYATHFKAVVIVVTCGYMSNLAAISTTVGATVPL